MTVVDLTVGTVVSIHAPAWGATSAALDKFAHPKCFNPRSRVGSDHSKAIKKQG